MEKKIIANDISKISLNNNIVTVHFSSSIEGMVDLKNNTIELDDNHVEILKLHLPSKSWFQKYFCCCCASRKR